ncbi:E3 ubiquitin-protein ligase RBBP6-like [Seriola lalandi dorsalis]|uniref:E3 ubiquitin-protein ligase RBBP6-like n=1 Tax=Seriola lalandi dorsalis TaxID=1841481 RepID=UPI000C6F8B59|nr:E3 ubiquitin-protein ligase RBBP6-like [Seriola lalandi dorsalis]
MTHVHYKFSSKLSYDTVVFDGPHITLTDLKRQIMGREKLRAGDCDLQITNAQTKQEYTDNEGLIPKGSSVIVRRIPISGGKSSSSGKNQNIERSDVHLHHAFAAVKAMNDQASSSALPFFSKMANLADADVSEEDKIKVMLNQSTYDTMNYNKKFGNVLPANYTCYRCGNTGHHIRNCPTSGQDKNFEAPLRIKKSTGIPRSFMVEVDDPNIKGAMLTNCGRYAIPAIDAEAYAIGKKEKPPFVPQEKPKSIEAEEDPVPDELLCLICHDLLSDAVVIPCCGNSYCDDCIRTTLLDSEDHVCPTCSQSNVSPDTLIANKFLRQAVNNFKKERGYTKSLTTSFGTSQSQNPTPTPSPVPTPPPLTVQSQSQKPPQSTHCQQDSLLHHPQAADTLPLSGNPPATTGPASSCNTPSTSLQTEQSSLEIPDKEAEGDLAAAAAATPSVLVSNKESTAAPSQLIPLVNHTTLAEQPQTVGVNEQQASSGPAPGHLGPSTCWGSSSSSSGCPNGGWTESQRLTSSSSSSSSYSATTPSLFPSPLFHTYLSAHQSHSSYPPGYPPTTPIWTLPCPQGAPIPSLCSSISTSSIPALIPKEWYKHQRKNKERSPHRGSSYRRSSSRSNSKSSKSKSSRSYSRSSSRSGSRSRSRSQGRSRPRSPYSRHRDLHTRSHPSHSYSYGYKRPRSPTPSSSSSPQVGYHSKSKSPSDHRKNRHHSRHHTKKSPSSSYSSRRRGEHSGNEEGGSGASLASSLHAHHANQTNSLELERERYLQWKKEYKEWCDKYFSSYVGHFHQLPPPFINLPPPPQWEGSKNHSHPNSDSHYGHTARTDGHSPLSQSSSDSRSPSSQSSSDSRSTPSQSSSVSRSSPSHTSNDSRSPPSQSSSDGRCTPSEEGAQPRAYQQQKDSHLPITLAKGSKEGELQERNKEDKQVIVKNLEDLSTLKHQQRRMKKHEEGRGEESSSCDATDSTDDSRKNERGHDTGPHACKDGTFVQDKAAARDTLKSFQPSLKPDKSLDKDCERKSREQRNVETEKGWRRGKDSRQDVERQHKVKPSKEADRVDSERYNNLGGSKASDSRSEKNRKRKGENLERNETRKNESPNPFDSKKQKTEKKKEKKTWPPTEKPPLWEGGITVKPQKKISININLDGRRMEEKTEIQGSIVGKSKDEIEKTGEGEEEKLNRDTEDEVNEKKESIRENESVFEEKIMPDEGEARQFCEKTTLIDDKREMWKKFTGGIEDREKKEERKEEDFYLWHYAFRGEKEEKGSKKQWGEDGMKASKGDATGKEEEEERMRKESRGQEMRELVRAEGESTSEENKGNPPGDSKPKEAAMEGVTMRTRTEEEDMLRFMSQRSSAESSRDRPNSNMDGGSSCEDCQERRAAVKTVEEFTQERAADREDPLVLVQVPHSKWKMDEPEEEEQNEGEITAEDPLPVVLPPPLVTTTKREREGEGENELKRQRSVDRDGDRDRAMQRGGDREKQKNLTLFILDDSVAPSSGKDRTDSTLCTERKMETERWRDRTRGRESERPRDKQRESRRSNERSKEDEKGRDRGREREHSSLASVQKRNSPSTGHVSSYSTYQDIERRDRQRGGEQDREKRSSLRPDRKHSGRERSSMSRAAVLPDKHAHKTHGDTLLDSKCKDKNHPHDYRNYRDPSGSHRHQGRPAGTHHSSPSHSHSQGRERELPPSESSSPKTSKSRMSSPGQEFMQSRSRNERKEEKQEWKRNKVNKLIEESKGERETREMEAERVGVSQWQDEADKLSGETKWQGGKELEEGERPSSGSRSRSSSSVSSSASQDKSRDDKRNERKKKQKHHKKEKSQATPELLEEWELKKHKHKKKTKKNKDGREEESGGEVDDRWKEEEDHAKLCSVMLS